MELHWFKKCVTKKILKKHGGLIRGGVIRKCVPLEKIHKDLTLKSDLLESANFKFNGCGPVGEGV